MHFEQRFKYFFNCSDRGTIMIYSKVSIQSEEPTMLLKQLNIQGPIHAVEKANEVTFALHT